MKALRPLIAWIDSDQELAKDNAASGLDWMRVAPFIALHLACLAVFWVGVSWVAVGACVASYVLRMFAITAFYHRYFAHRAFRASRPVQFVFALIGASATQRGPLWWAAHHRIHHKRADRDGDPHSPNDGLLWSHMGWFLGRRHFGTAWEQIPDLAKFPELRWLDRFDVVVPVVYAALFFALGAGLERWAPGLETSGSQMLVWGYFVSTVILIHATLTINSLAHRFGTRRFETRDQSRNNPWLAVLTLGEGWHNNHHAYPGSARQGFYWWEIDISYALLRVMALFGLVRDLKPVPEGLLEARRVRS